VHITGWASDASALAAFLEEPNLCRVATVDAEVRPHVVPTWFWWDGHSFWVGAQARDRKVANIRARGNAGIEVDADLRRRRGILATGAARIIDGDEGRSEYVRITAEQVRRYQPDRPPLATAERYVAKGTPVVIEVTPDRVMSWGR
jgi:nitroimidazol reductase NimA-like FMN-containing flavoprotein (pyridoxamine 5'-phosphate oxidase superfamily)